MKKFFLLPSLVLLYVSLAVAADKQIVLQWPEQKPQLKITVLRFRELDSFHGQRSFLIDLTAQNVSGKVIPSATAKFLIFDKSKVRIGDGQIEVSNVGVEETVKIQMPISLSGSPATMTMIDPVAEAARKISLTVYTVPSGALLKVDGAAHGVTPQMVTLQVGSHMLEFAKEGYTNGRFPLVISPDQLNGGSVSFELGSAMHDTVELRDGTVLSGDVESLDGNQATVRIGGNVQAIPRNKIQRILLIEREPVAR